MTEPNGDGTPTNSQEPAGQNEPGKDPNNPNNNPDINDPGPGNEPGNEPGKEPANQEPTDGAPETYTDFNFPEGVQVDDALMSEATKVFKELGLSQESAQRVVDLQIGAIQSHQDSVIKTMDGWEAELKADKDFGGDNFDENISVAKNGVDKLNIEGLSDFLERSGLGSNPFIVKAFWAIGKMMKEDSPGAGNPPNQEKSREERMYPDDKPRE